MHTTNLITRLLRNRGSLVGKLSAVALLIVVTLN